MNSGDYGEGNENENGGRERERERGKGTGTVATMNSSSVPRAASNVETVDRDKRSGLLEPAQCQTPQNTVI